MNRAVPLVLAIALFMQMMDSTVTATALPAIARDIGTEPVALKLAMTTYLVALAIFIPVSGWMADRFGAKNVFRWSILVFVLGSIACSLSFSLETFVASRFLQGMGGALMTPLARLVLVRATPRNQLVNAMSWLTVPALVGPLVGPPLGGFLTTYLSWHWIFYINVPIGLAGIVAASLVLPQVTAQNIRPMDWPGFVLAGLAFSGLLLGFSVISLPALPPIVGLVTGTVGLLAGLIYILHARRAEHPLLDLKLFALPLFRTALIGGSLFRIGIGAVPFLLPLMLQLGFGLSPFDAGLITFYSAAGAILAKFIAPAVFARFGFRGVSLSMTLLSAALLAALGLFDKATPAFLMVIILFVSGIVRSTFFTGINALGFADVSEEQTSQATAITSVFQQLSFAVGIAVGGATLEILANLGGGEIRVTDFHVSFFVVGIVSAFAFLPFLSISRDAAADVSGQLEKRERKRRHDAAAVEE